LFLGRFIAKKIDSPHGSQHNICVIHQKDAALGEILQLKMPDDNAGAARWSFLSGKGCRSFVRYATLLILVLLGVPLAGCQRQIVTGPLQPKAGASLAEATRVVNPTPLPRTGPGQLAYVGGDGNIYVTTADGTKTIAVTDDATAPPEFPGRSYHRISWSPQGQLAFASVQRQGNTARSKLYVVESPGEPARLVGQSDRHFVIYIYWSPIECADQESCRRLAYLIEEEDGISLRLVEIAEREIENRRIGTGWPFYFSWKGNGRQILGHTGRSDENRLAVYDLQQGRVQSLAYPPGLFQAPAWAPEGEDWLAVSTDGTDYQLQRFASGQAETVATAADGFMSFVWSPQGERIAYAVQKKRSDLFAFGPIQIFDPKTGQSRQITADRFRIAGFFWSPDGQKVGYLIRFPDSDWLQWRMYDLNRDKDRGFEAFNPSLQTQYMISSFNQYAQSHRFWSPDSRYLVYADRDRFLVERVWLIDTWADKWADPILIGEGTLGVWSWN
jgi:TolB protein